MKKIFALLLVVSLFLSFGLTAFAAGSPVKQVEGPDSSTIRSPGIASMGVFNSAGEKIGSIPNYLISKWSIYYANALGTEDKESFLTAYDGVKSVTDKLVKDFFWLGVSKSYEFPDGFAYCEYPFTCAGENVKLTVNGKEMELTKGEGNNYTAKMTEFGPVTISCDLSA